MDLIAWISIAFMAIMFLSGVPLAVAFAFGSSIIALLVMGMPVGGLAQLFFSSINSYPLLACPFFILAGNLILRSGAMEPLEDFLQAMFGHLTGGLAVVAVIFSAFLGSISGSAAACLAILGTIMVPLLVNAGYDKPFASGLCLTGSELGMLIPPSLFFIIFGALNRLSIADLFLAGVGPGLLTTFFMALLVMWKSKKRNYPVAEKASIKITISTLIKALPVIIMPFIVLGGIYSGIFSPTQAASVAAVYSLFIGVFVYRGLNIKHIMLASNDTVRISSMIYFIIIGADLLGRMFAFIELPQKITEWVIGFGLGPQGFMLVVTGLLLVMGCFFSSIPMVIVVLPLFLPSVYNLGIDPIYYGAVAVMNSLIGEVTPPFGPQLWIAGPLCGEKIGAIAREAWPFLGVWTLALMLTVIFPNIAMFLVEIIR